MRFTKEEDEYLIKNHTTKTIPQMVIEMKRTDMSIHRHMELLGLTKKFIRNKFTKEEDKFILDNLSNRREFIALKLNRSVQSIQNRVRYLAKEKLWMVE